MSTTRILDKTDRVIEIVWEQKASPDDFDRITGEVKRFSKELGGRFNVLVDMRSVKAFLPESQAKLVEHQKDLLSFGMQRAAVVVQGAIAKMQLNRSSKQSENAVESHWDSYEEALAFLKANK
ncbi:hypothetical protein DNH61_11060 [Paenibacillus sambharensis]|uniref:STAS/SEC14 domain-containing protein n=1 Tax=Paenibacillus sambharensis TaxID=1803190 RepID=A0A2W1LM65_9BACL|nr:hypothetical protein [Paenibacillus sambharensis]PZD95965.1 hypothetical protein DNH61_11060 [Paenibacillus sambharensis]